MLLDEKENNKKELPVEINSNQLSTEALNGIVENFILREGTDYGVVEVDHDKKRDQVLKQINCGDVKIIFDFNTETINLITATDFKNLQKTNS